MSRPGDKAVVFDTNTWKLGTRGLGGSFQNQRCHIENLRLYHDGSLGPRPLWRKPVVNSGTGTYYTSAFGANAIIQPGVARSTYLASPSAGWTIVPGPSTGFNPRFEFISGGVTNIYLAGTNFGQSQGPHAWVDRIGDYAYLLSGVYTTASVASPFFTYSSGNAAIETLFSGALTYQPGGSAYHNGRGFYWGAMLDGSNIGSLENRMYYSDLNAPTTFTSATQTFDMEWPIAGAQSLGSVLLIWGPSGQWAALQGGRDTPANGTIVPLGRGRVPAKGRQPAVFDNNLVFLSSDLMSMVTVGENGQVDDIPLGHLGQQEAPANYQTGNKPPVPAVSSVYNTLLVPWAADSHAYHNQRGVWTVDNTTISLGSDYVVRFDDSKGEEQLIVWDGSKWVHYYRPVGYDPSGPTQLYDEISGSLDFRETMYSALRLPRVSEPTRQVRLTRAVVTGRYWGSALYDAPAWEPTVDSASFAPVDLTAGPSSSLFSNTNAVGDAFRADLRPTSELPMDHYFELRLDSMQSVSVEQVVIEYEVSEQEAW